jgi:type I restriction enzyme R subunit
VIQEMIEIRKQLDAQRHRAESLGISEEELAFYDALGSDANSVYANDFLRDLVHEIVQAVKKNLHVDWTAPHREDVRAAIRAAVKRTLRNRGVRPEDFDRFVDAVMEQAETSFADWPLAA